MNYLSDLHAGRAGEHLVAADLLRKGFECFEAAQGMPYDLVVDAEGVLLRVQVKTTRKPEVLPGKNRRAYRFWVSRCGKRGSKVRLSSDVDLFALVALDTCQIGYLPSSLMVKTLFIAPDEERGSHVSEQKSLRNTKILEAIKTGSDFGSIAAEYGVTPSHVSRVNTGRAQVARSVTYFSDLPFPVLSWTV